jgi:hypothetical protein
MATYPNRQTTQGSAADSPSVSAIPAAFHQSPGAGKQDSLILDCQNAYRCHQRFSSSNRI